jgi:hypothetical protein
MTNSWIQFIQQAKQREKGLRVFCVDGFVGCDRVDGSHKDVKSVRILI